MFARIHPFIRFAGLPLIAIFGAFLIWFYSALNRRYEETAEMPIRIVNLDPSLLPVNPISEIARVQISGTGRQLIALRIKSAELLVSAAGAVKGNNIIKLSADNLEFSDNPGIRTIQVKEPQFIQLNLDAVVTKTVRVVTDLRFSVSRNTAVIGEPACSPPFAAIVGPRENVALIDSVVTRPIQIKEISSDTIVTIPLKQPELFSVSVKPDEVTVKINVDKLIRREIKGIPVKLIDIPKGVLAVVDAHSASIVVAGPKKTVESLRKEHINIYVPYSRFETEASDEMEPLVSILGDIQWSNLNPKRVKLIKNDNSGH